MNFLNIFLKLPSIFFDALDILWMGMLSIFIGITFIYLIILILSKLKDRDIKE